MWRKDIAKFLKYHNCPKCGRRVRGRAIWDTRQSEYNIYIYEGGEIGELQFHEHQPDICWFSDVENSIKTYKNNYEGE